MCFGTHIFQNGRHPCRRGSLFPPEAGNKKQACVCKLVLMLFNGNQFKEAGSAVYAFAGVNDVVTFFAGYFNFGIDFNPSGFCIIKAGLKRYRTEIRFFATLPDFVIHLFLTFQMK